MIPLSDASRRPLNFPRVTVCIIVANALVFVLELVGGAAFLNRWSLVPAEVMAGQNWITILTAMFMHAGWAHILGIPISLNFYRSGSVAPRFAIWSPSPPLPVPVGE